MNEIMSGRPLEFLREGHDYVSQELGEQSCSGSPERISCPVTDTAEML